MPQFCVLVATRLKARPVAQCKPVSIWYRALKNPSLTLRVGIGRVVMWAGWDWASRDVLLAERGYEASAIGSSNGASASHHTAIQERKKPGH